MTVHQAQPPSIRTVHRVRLSGEYDMSNASRLVDALLEDPDADVVVGNLTDVTFMDSTSVRALLEARNRLLADGRALELEDPSPVVRTLLEVCGMGALFGLSDSNPSSPPS